MTRFAKKHAIAPMIEAHPEGAFLYVVVKPKASRNGLIGIHAERVKVAVTAPPEKGKANAAVLEVVAKQLGLKRSQVSLVSGETNSMKTLLVRNVVPDELRQQVDAVLRTIEKDV